MEVVGYDHAMADEVCGLYNRVIEGVPFCYPTSPGRLDSELARDVGPGDWLGRRPGDLHSAKTFVAREGGALLGFVQAGVGRLKETDEAERGVIRFLSHERGRRAAGQSLVEAAEEHLRGLGVAEIQAFPHEYRYQFYHLRAAHLSDRLDHVAALLAFNNYRRAKGEVYYDWADFEPRSPRATDVEGDVTAEPQGGRGSRPGLVVKATSGGEVVGECRSVSCAEFSDVPEAAERLFTVWLGVADGLQGRGLGRHLLGRALVEARALGYRHAVISTSLDNYRAQVFYSNFGYRLADWTYVLAKIIAE